MSIFKAEAGNPVIRAEAGNDVFKSEAGNGAKWFVDTDVCHIYLTPVLPLVSMEENADEMIEKLFERMQELCKEPPKPSEKLIELMNRKPRYEKHY